MHGWCRHCFEEQSGVLPIHFLNITHTHTLTLALTYSHSATVLSEQFGLDVVLLDVVYTALYGIVFCNLILTLD